MRCSRKPVVAVRGTWAGDLIERYGAGLTYADGDVEEMEGALSRVIGDIDAYRTAVAEIRDSIAATYAPERLIEFLRDGQASPRAEAHAASDIEDIRERATRMQRMHRWHTEAEASTRVSAAVREDDLQRTIESTRDQVDGLKREGIDRDRRGAPADAARAAAPRLERGAAMKSDARAQAIDQATLDAHKWFHAIDFGDLSSAGRRMPSSTSRRAGHAPRFAGPLGVVFGWAACSPPVGRLSPAADCCDGTACSCSRPASTSLRRRCSSDVQHGRGPPKFNEPTTYFLPTLPALLAMLRTASFDPIRVAQATTQGSARVSVLARAVRPSEVRDKTAVQRLHDTYVDSPTHFAFGSTFFNLEHDDQEASRAAYRGPDSFETEIDVMDYQPGVPLPAELEPTGVGPGVASRAVITSAVRVATDEPGIMDTWRAKNAAARSFAAARVRAFAASM